MFEEVEKWMEELRKNILTTVKSLIRAQLEFGKTYEGSICPYRSDKGACALNGRPCVDTLPHPPINKAEKQYWLKCPAYNSAWLEVSR